MYKKLLNKGFKPYYYTNDDFLTSTSCDSRLFYTLKVNNEDLINSILNVLNKYNDYFNILLEPDLVTWIEIDEFLESFWWYFYNTDKDNIEIASKEMEKILEILPNKFIFEHRDW